LKVTIKYVDNGFIVTGPNPNAEGDISLVFEQKHEGDLKHIKYMLYQVLEFFGIYYSKHNEKNVVIKVVKNDGIHSGN
jgi:hypothetical protein